MRIQILGEEIDLLPQKAFIWSHERLLVFSDVHLGKAESFQSLGVPIPSSVHYEDLNRIASLIEEHSVQKVLILGDLIHHKNAWSEELLNTLMSFFHHYPKVQFKLLIGNHEKGSLEYLKLLPLELITGDYEISPFTFSHGHEKSKADFTVQGHIHPVITLNEGPVRLRIPCFVLDPNTLTLPAFGGFTGGFEVGFRQKRRIFLVTPEKVIELD